MCPLVTPEKLNNFIELTEAAYNITSEVEMVEKSYQNNDSNDELD